jgi:2,4-didehydro-3-deoxy-L-rhamnonate hydrolase
MYRLESTVSLGTGPVCLLVGWMVMMSGYGQGAEVTVSELPESPFKLATYSLQEEMHVGMVFGDKKMVNLLKANQSLESRTSLAHMTLSDNMLDLLALEDKLFPRLYQIANYVQQHLLTDNPPGFVHDLSAVTLEAPILYPRKLLNAAGNYYDHMAEMREKVPEKSVPYLFFKAPTTTIIGVHDVIQIPEGRDKIDWEVELAVVIGRHAKNISTDQVDEYIFGYTILNDVSDRGDRGNTDFGSNWFPGKSHDTFGPMGPYIVPRAFISDPANLKLQTRVNGQLMQDSNSRYLTYTIPELVAYAASISTLEPGDVISTGTPSGVGAGRGIFLKPGDVVTVSVEGIGSLENPVR